MAAIACRSVARMRGDRRLKKQTEWMLSVLALISAVALLLVGAWAFPMDQRFPMLASACLAFALWLVIGLRPGR